MTESTTTQPSRGLLAAGVVAGPLFVITVLVQSATRDGFDPKIHPLSMLSLGDLGWIQITNFVLSGLLFVAAAVGLRRTLRAGPGRTWGPILIGVFGVSLVWGGVFVTDPAFGFPPGTPEGQPDQLSWHGILHTIGPTVAGIALIAACVVFARRYAREGHRGWATYSVVTAVVYLVLALVAFPADDFRPALAGGALIWLWASAIAARSMAVTTHPATATTD